MKILEKLTAILSLPASYRAFGRLVGGPEVWREYLHDYVKPVSGEKVLDIGCGPADALDFLPGVNYTGLDISPEYIDSARRRFGNRGRFWCGDVGLASLEGEEGTFDLVLATGVVHHLDDQTAASMFELARQALRPSGRLITYDGCYVPNQSRAARWMLNTDRGKFIRSPAEYQRLALGAFFRVEPYLREDLLRIPYSLFIMRCSNPPCDGSSGDSFSAPTD